MKLLPKFLNKKTPGYLRLFFPAVKNISKGKFFKFNKLQIIKPLKKYNIISYGYMLKNCEIAINSLKKKKIEVGLVNCHSVKPFDEGSLKRICNISKILFVVEDHNSFGGLGSIISQIVSSKFPTKIVSINTNDKFGTTGLPEENLEYLGLSSDKIVNYISKNVFKK